MATGEIKLQSGRTNWIELSDGKDWPHDQCYKCCNYVLRNDMAYCASELAICLSCREEVRRENPRPRAPVDDPVLKVMNGKMMAKHISPKAGLPGRLKQTMEHLEMLKGKGLVKYHADTFQWEKVVR